MNWFQKIAQYLNPAQIFDKLVRAFDLHPIAENHPKGKFYAWDYTYGTLMHLSRGDDRAYITLQAHAKFDEWPEGRTIKGTIGVSNIMTNEYKRATVEWPASFGKYIPNDIVERVYSMLDGFDRNEEDDEIGPFSPQPSSVKDPVEVLV